MPQRVPKKTGLVQGNIMALPASILNQGIEKEARRTARTKANGGKQDGFTKELGDELAAQRADGLFGCPLPFARCSLRACLKGFMKLMQASNRDEDADECPIEPDESRWRRFSVPAVGVVIMQIQLFERP